MGLKERWEDFMFWLEEHHIPKPAFFGLIIALIFILFLLFGGLELLFPTPKEEVTLRVIVVDKENNPIPQANVTIRSEEITKTEKTDDEGKATFIVYDGSEVVIEAEYGEESARDTVVVEGFTEKTIMLDVELVTYSDKKIIFYKEGTTERYKDIDSIDAVCSNTDWQAMNIPVIDGEATLRGVPSNCGKLSIKVKDEWHDISVEDYTPAEIYLKEEEKKGRLIVKVVDTENNPVKANAVEVSVTNYLGQLVGSQKTNSSGTVVFSDLPAGTYTITAVSESYKPSTATAIVEEGKDTVTTLYVEPVFTGYPIKIRVVDTKGTGVKDVELQLRDAATQQILVNKRYTDLKGEYVFSVTEEKEYLVILSLPNGWKKQLKVTPSESFYEVTYDEKELEKGGTVVFEVKDQDKEPIESATVELYKIDHSAAGYSCVTGSDGLCEIERVKPDRYYAQVKLYSYSPAITEDFEVLPGETVTVGPIILEISKGIFELTVVNENSKPISNATIEAYDLGERKLLKSVKTDDEGIASLSIRTDKTPYFVITAKGYLPYITVPMTPVPETTVEKTIILRKEFAGIKAEFLGLTHEEETVEGTVSPGASYTGSFLLIVGKADYTKVGFHIRTGKDIVGKINKVEADNGYISQINASATTLLKGSTYSPPKGESSDLKSVAEKEIKWANIEWDMSKIKKGVFEIEASIVIRDSALAGDLFKLSYRAYGISASYERDPQDEVLSGKKSTSEKDALYARTYDIVYSIGLSNLCDEYFCQSYAIEDLSTKIKLAVVDKYSAKIGNKYKLYFTINNKSADIANGVFFIENEQKGLLFGEYEIYDASGRKFSGTLDGSSAGITIGSFPEKSTISGTITFETLKEGSQVLTLGIQSEGERILENSLTIEVPAGKEMILEMIPKNVIAMIDNELLFKVMDKETEEPVEGASIVLLLDDKFLTTGATNSEGVFAFTLEAPSPGAKLKVKVTKPGYNPLSKTIEVSEEVFNIIPPEIKVELSPIGGSSVSFSFAVENLSAIPLEIDSIALEGDLNELVEIEGMEGFEGKIVEAGKKLDIELKAELTNKGKKVKEITELESSLTVNVTNKTIDAIWTKTAKLNIRIVLEDALETTDCLIVEPQEWEINTTTKQRQFAFTLKNACSVGKQPVPLRELAIRIYWGVSNELGSFSISNPDLGIEEKPIGATYTVIVDYLPPEFEGEFLVVFTPDPEIASGEAQAKLQIKAKHFSKSGKEEVKAEINTNINVNNIAECIAIIKKEPLELRTCGYDTGWGNSLRYFDRDPYASDQQTQPQPGQQTTFMQPWQAPMQPTWPSTQIQPPWQTSFSTQPYGTGWKCEAEKATITLENNCTADVVVSIIPHSALSVEPTELEISAGSSESFEVSPTARLGKFNIEIRAKLKDSKEPWRKIEKIYFTVMRFTDVSEKCYPVIEPTTLRANFLGWQKATGRIYNKCYNLGFRLERISKENFHCASPETGGVQIAPGPCPLIKEIYFSPPTLKEVSESEVWEIMEFSIWYDPTITQHWPVLLEGPIDKRIGMIRVASSSLYSAVVSPGEVYVPMYVPFLGQVKYFKVSVTFEDPFEWFGIAGMLIDAGDPNKAPSECVNKEALNVPAAGEEYEFIGDDFFKNDVFVWKENPPKSEWVLPVASSNEQIVGVPGVEQATGFCGRSDYIERLPYTTWTDPASGVVLTFKLTHNRHHIVMTVDRSQMFTKCAKIDFQYPIKVTRVFNNPGTEEVALHVAVNVLNKGVKEYYEGCEYEKVTPTAIPEWALLEPCENNTGTEPYLRYGFDKLLFTWKPENITSATCAVGTANASGFFCDGTQFMLSISGTLTKIKEKVEKLDALAKSDESLMLVANIIASDPELMKEINEPGKMYKIMKKQTVITDSVQGRNLLVFLQDPELGGGLLPAPKVENCDVSELESSLTNLVESLSPETEEYAALHLLGFKRRFEAKLRECYLGDIEADNVIGIIFPEIENQMAATNGKDIWSALSSPAIESIPMIEYNNEIDAYVITFEEYMKLHNDILQGVLANIRTGDRGAPIEVTIGNAVLQADEQTWLEFLQILKENMEFKLVVLNKPNMSAELEDYVKMYAEDYIKDESAESSEEGITLVNLKTENFSPTFISDFLAAYPGIPLQPNQIEFKQYMSLENSLFSNDMKSTRITAGQYAYRIDPKITLNIFDGKPVISLDKFIIKLHQEKSLEGIDAESGTAYAENPLMYLSFDAPLGKGSTNADYGVAFSNLPEEALYYSLEDTQTYGEIPSRGPGITTLQMSFSNKFEKTREGKVIELDLRKNMLKYIPSYPASLKISSSGTQNNVVYYRFNIPAYCGTVNELFVWFQLNGSEEMQVDEFKMFEPATFCEGWNEPRKVAKLFTPPGDWYSVTFVPYIGTGETLQLELMCAMQPTILKAKVFEGSETQTQPTTGLPGGSVKLNEPRAAPSIKEYIDRINSGEICIDTINKNSLTLRWNPAVVELPT